MRFVEAIFVEHQQLAPGIEVERWRRKVQAHCADDRVIVGCVAGSGFRKRQIGAKKAQRQAAQALLEDQRHPLALAPSVAGQDGSALDVAHRGEGGLPAKGIHIDGEVALQKRGGIRAVEGQHAQVVKSECAGFPVGVADRGCARCLRRVADHGHCPMVAG